MYAGSIPAGGSGQWVRVTNTALFLWYNGFMAHHSYNRKEYREKQSIITKANWKKGVFDFIYKREKRKCSRRECTEIFEVNPSDPKIYCSSNCSALVNNAKRGPMSLEQKLKISKTLQGRKIGGFENPFKGKIKVARVEVTCRNPKCGKIFLMER